MLRASIVFLKEKVGIYRWLSMAGGFLGILVVLRPGVEQLHPAALGILPGASLIVMSGLFLFYREHVRHRDITAVITVHGGFEQD